jgi:enterochelin esterase family protein
MTCQAKRAAYHAVIISENAMKKFAIVAAMLCLALPAFAEGTRKPVDYPLSADSQVKAVPHGQVIGPVEFHSKVFPGTVRRYWVYVPAGYQASNPPNLLVFQDGQRALNPGGPLRINTVLDNLIADGSIPQTIGVFVTPGNLSER